MKINLTKTERTFLGDRLKDARRLQDAADACLISAFAVIGEDRGIQIPANKARITPDGLEWDDLPTPSPTPPTPPTKETPACPQ